MKMLLVWKGVQLGGRGNANQSAAILKVCYPLSSPWQSMYMHHPRSYSSQKPRNHLTPLPDPDLHTIPLLLSLSMTNTLGSTSIISSLGDRSGLPSSDIAPLPSLHSHRAFQNSDRSPCLPDSSPPMASCLTQTKGQAPLHGPWASACLLSCP